MLGIDYSTQLGQVIASIDWCIELPIEWSDYFQQRGEHCSYADDERNNQRLKIRAFGALWFDQSLPFRPRSSAPMGIYTRDFSRQGAGFLAPVELYPEEHVRIVLPTFWVQLRVVRTRRITAQCFEIGAVLLKRHDPGNEAFVIPEHACV
ncbi:MAG: hypothetical protein ACR2NZ_13265 [Rubripirellula sp.]